MCTLDLTVNDLTVIMLTVIDLTVNDHSSVMQLVVVPAESAPASAGHLQRQGAHLR